ncbi:hypothetical protein TI39_contig336g00063 [Zymoseptoria brevis]|uniref:AtmA protein n=1 Tax=Zymoseptoria brevis TaxID=1047168 RepID=A0A0F4GSD0_9PEZI|nr:hypothetical protein TI39_contig336g00063 [Zymoseptoria brevis]
MSAVRPFAIALLAGLVVTAHFALAKQSEWNGTIILENVLANPVKILPGTNIPLSLPRTGLDKLDNFFAFMAAFFHTTLDSRNVRAHWQGNHLLGTLSSIWIMMLSEAHGSTSTGFFFATYFFEVMGELLGIGLFTPIWAITHLLMVRNPTETVTKPTAAPSGHSKALGYALMIGHVVPSAFLLRTQPDGQGILSQPLWAIIRLFHPVWVYVAWKTITVLGGKSAASLSIQPAFFTRRKFYVFSILASGIFHITSLAYLLSGHLASGWLKEDVVAVLDARTVLIPTQFYPESVVQKVPFETGVAIFLQWDYLCSSAAIVIWAATLSAEAISASKKKSGGSVLETYAQAGLVSILAGPGAAAAFLLQERDAVLAAPVELVEKKRQ